jgi:hypothetical protein
MEQAIYKRKFESEYFEINETLWSITSVLQDSIHDIRTTLEISVPDLVVQQASIEFVRYPLQECLLVPAKIQALTGANLFDDFMERANQLFGGADGCPNVINLLRTSGPAFIYFYFPDLIKKGKLKNEDWWSIIAAKLSNQCIAHQMIHQKYTGIGQKF